MEKNNVYLYGMILLTNSFLLRNGFPKQNTYAEVREKYILPGGETGTCATVLANLGCHVKLDGTHMGEKTAPVIREFYRGKSVDLSSLSVEEDSDGLEDYVLIDSQTRTCFGTFGSFFADKQNHWNRPKREDVQESGAVGLDPFFNADSEAAAEYCRELGKPYVTIDCPYDSRMNCLSSINALSHEYLSQTYGDCDQKSLLSQYMASTGGLVIFTHGAGEILYGRNGKIHSFPAFPVHPISTLGAGDTFKAGCVYALLNHMDDGQTVRFAAAAAAVACTSFPLPLNPPNLASIQATIQSSPVTG